MNLFYYIVAPICHGTNSKSPRPCFSDFDFSPEATLTNRSNISLPTVSMLSLFVTTFPALTSISSFICSYISVLVAIFIDGEGFEPKAEPLPVVKPGTQTRRFTHIQDTIEICFKAWKSNNNYYYSISNKKSYSILEVAKMFKSTIKFFPKRKGERFASALTTMSLSHKVLKNFGKRDLRKYIGDFLYKNQKKPKLNNKR